MGNLMVFMWISHGIRMEFLTGVISDENLCKPKLIHGFAP